MNRICHRLAVWLAASLVLAGCYSPDAKIAADAMGEEDRAAYLVLTDQLQRVRNVLKKPAKVCLGYFPDDTFGGLGLVPPKVLTRLLDEQAALEPKLDLVADVGCLAHYVQDKGGFAADPSDVLAYAGIEEGSSNQSRCGRWFGGLYNQGNLDRQVNYDISVKDGIAELSGGEDCSAIRWYRS